MMLLGTRHSVKDEFEDLLDLTLSRFASLFCWICDSFKISEVGSRVFEKVFGNFDMHFFVMTAEPVINDIKMYRQFDTTLPSTISNANALDI